MPCWRGRARRVSRLHTVSLGTFAPLFQKAFRVGATLWKAGRKGRPHGTPHREVPNTRRSRTANASATQALGRVGRQRRPGAGGREAAARKSQLHSPSTSSFECDKKERLPANPSRPPRNHRPSHLPGRLGVAAAPNRRYLPSLKGPGGEYLPRTGAQSGAGPPWAARPRWRDRLAYDDRRTDAPAPGDQTN